MYFSEVADNLKAVLPITLGAWGIFAVSMMIDMRRFRNSFFLLFALLFTMFDLAALFGPYAPMATAFMLFAVIALLFSVPSLLVMNGVHMLKREGRSLANILSLVFGLVIGAGEIAAVAVAFSYSYIQLTHTQVKLMSLFASSVFFVSAVFLAFMFYSRFIQYIPHFRQFDYVVVLGCGLLQGDRMSKLLSQRCDAGISIYKRSKVKPKMIPSGGQGPDEKISEAAAMAKYMIEQGVCEEDIILEDQSLNTMQNLANSKAIIEAREGGRRTIVCTSNYHLYRALSYSRKLKFRCSGRGAKVAGYYWPSALIREFAAVMKEKRHIILFLLAYLLWISPLLFY